MIFNLRIIEADDVPVMDANGLCDPYCKLYFSARPKETRLTKIIQKTLKPTFNDAFAFDVTGFSPSDFIFIKMKDQDFARSENISSLKLQLIDFKLGKVYDFWCEMEKDKKVKKGGRIHLTAHLALKGETPFVDTSEKHLAESINSSPTDENANQTENSIQEPKSKDEADEEEQEEYFINYDYIGTVANATKEKKDYSKYNISIVSFSQDKIHIEDNSNNVGAELARQMASRGVPIKSTAINSSIKCIKKYFDDIKSDPKSLVLLIGSTATTDRLRLIAEGFNNTNFIISDLEGESPIGEKILEDREEKAVIENPINLDEVNKASGSLFKISHDNDRFLFNYLYTVALSNVNKKIGGCVFIETPLIETIQIQYQIDSITCLLDSLLDLPAFN